jgi:hypothetical protein
MGAFNAVVVGLLLVAFLASIFIEKLTFFGPLFLGCLLLMLAFAWAMRSEGRTSELRRDEEHKTAA